MKILFVSSGNSNKFDIVPFIKSQGESLKILGVEVEYFPVLKNGLLGYIQTAWHLHRFLRNRHFDVIHAHYTLSGYTAVLARPSAPIVLSLMGTDAYGDYVRVNKVRFMSRYLIFLTQLIQPFVSAIICKSKHIESFVYRKKISHIIPNGILLEKFQPYPDLYIQEKKRRKEILKVLFFGDKQNCRKNYSLLLKAVQLIDDIQVQIIAPYPVRHEEVLMHLNTSDCLVVPSLMEGSPNIVKEAMACNCPVVATNVGDVAWLFGNEPGYFLTSFDPNDVADKIRQALDFAQQHGRTKGRERIIELGLDAETIAKRLVVVYEEVNKLKS